MKKIKTAKLNDRGAALVIAIVVVAFISILTTILLYLATMNFQMKATDYNTKVSFYGAETPLEELRSLLVMDVCSATDKAYAQVIQNYGNYTAAEREAVFQDIFLKEFQDIWKTRANYNAGEADKWKWESGINTGLGLVSTNTSSYHVINDTVWSNSSKCGESTCTKPYHIILDSTTDDERLKKVTETVDGKTKVSWDLKGIQVIYTENNFTSIIKTTYNISVPPIDLSVEKFVDTWEADDKTKNRQRRTEVLFEGCVVYKDWTKQ